MTLINDLNNDRGKMTQRYIPDSDTFSIHRAKLVKGGLMKSEA